MSAVTTGSTHNALQAVLLIGLLMLGNCAWSATLERPDEDMRRALINAINSSDSFADRFDAEVWLTDMNTRLGSRVENPEERLAILRQVHYEARRANLDPQLVLALIQVESNFDRFAISSAGAQGLMQIMPFWLDEIGKPEDNLFDIETNLRFGCTILSLYLEREKGDMHRALARYNGSVGEHWYPRRVYTALRKRWYQQ
jgi:soluble lytic murein transglycosylase-like protein